jgi:hypothetical protein
MFIPALKPTHPAIQWVLRSVSPEVKRPLREVDQSSPSNAELGMSDPVPPRPHTSLGRVVYLSAGIGRFMCEVS